MKVELKNVKVYEQLSEETTAFTATIYLNGKKAGDAKNDGHGGNTSIYISDATLRAAFESYAKALPTKIVGTFVVPMNAEVLIDEMVYEHQLKKEEQKIKRIALKEKAKNTARGWPVTFQVYVKNSPTKGSFVMWVGARSVEALPRLLNDYRKHYKTETVTATEVLNEKEAS